MGEDRRAGDVRGTQQEGKQQARSLPVSSACFEVSVLASSDLFERVLLQRDPRCRAPC